MPLGPPTMTSRQSPSSQLATSAAPELLGATTIPLPRAWRGEVGSQLSAEEKLLAWLEIDLDESLRYAAGLVVLTSRRLLARQAGESQWQSFNYRAGLSLTRRDHSRASAALSCSTATGGWPSGVTHWGATWLPAA